MTTLLHWLYDRPLWVGALTIVTPIVALSIGGTLLLRRRIPLAWSESKDAVGACASAVGVIYAVLLGMIAVAAWDDYTDLGDKVATEASLANNLFRDADGLPETTRLELQKLYRQYVGQVFCSELPLLQQGDLATCRPPTRTTVERIVHVASTFKPQDLGEANVHRETLSVVNQLLSMRRARLLSADEHLLPILWIVVLAGGLVTMALSWLLHVQDRRLNLLLNGIYSLVVGLMIFCIFTLDHPFWGQVSVDLEPFKYVARSMDGLNGNLGIKDCTNDRPRGDLGITDCTTRSDAPNAD
jgi:hypothetical protein